MRTVEIKQDGDELVAAESRQGVAFAQTIGHPSRDLGEQTVAGRMPEHVVNLLEPVQIEVSHRQALLLPQGVQHGLMQPVLEQRTVRQRRQGIEMYETVEFLLLLLERSNVGKDSDIVADRSVFVGDGIDRQRRSETLAVAAPVPYLARPVPLVLDVRPQGSNALAVVGGFGEDARGLAEYLVAAISGYFGEGVVGVENERFGGDDGDPFGRRREDAGGQAAQFVGLVSLGDAVFQQQVLVGDVRQLVGDREEHAGNLLEALARHRRYVAESADGLLLIGPDRPGVSADLRFVDRLVTHLADQPAGDVRPADGDGGAGIPQAATETGLNGGAVRTRYADGGVGAKTVGAAGRRPANDLGTQAAKAARLRNRAAIRACDDRTNAQGIGELILQPLNVIQVEQLLEGNRLVCAVHQAVGGN